MSNWLPTRGRPQQAGQKTSFQRNKYLPRVHGSCPHGKNDGQAEQTDLPRHEHP